MISKKELIDIICNNRCHHVAEMIRKNCHENNSCRFLCGIIQYAKEHGLLTEPEMAWHQRGEEEIQASLDRLGYVKDENGDLTHPLFPSFRLCMWKYCGKRILWETDMLTEWVELREVQE